MLEFYVGHESKRSAQSHREAAKNAGQSAKKGIQESNQTRK